jgi:hypothetical protein
MVLNWKLGVGVRGLRATAWLGLVCVLVVGCGREQISVYEVSKERAGEVGHSHSHGVTERGGSGMESDLPRLSWELPEGWREGAASGMNLARFTVPSDKGAVEASVLVLPGVADKELEVINILRERFNLEPLDEAGLAAVTERVALGGGEVDLYDMSALDGAGGAGARLLVAVLTAGGSSWYLRMSGVSAAVEEQREAYLGWLKTVSLGRGVGVGMGIPGEEEGAGMALPRWEVPEGWREEAPPRMVMARFRAGPVERELDITVSVFPGDVGGLVANVNRWRGQVGLGMWSEAEVMGAVERVEMADGEGQWVEFVGELAGVKVRLIGVTVPRGGRTWFYKLVGDEGVAAGEREAFLTFVRGARHP